MLFIDNDFFDSQDQLQGLLLGIFGLADYTLLILLITLGLFLGLIEIRKLQKLEYIDIRNSNTNGGFRHKNPKPRT